MNEDEAMDRVFDEPHPPAPPLITEEVLLADLPSSDDPRTLARDYLKQNLLGEALLTYKAGLSTNQPMGTRLRAADKIVSLALEEEATPKGGINVNFSFGGKFSQPPEITVGETIDTGEEGRY